MARATTPARRRATRKTGGLRDAIPAATFKATCLELMDRVRETGTEFIVTKHGRPVVKVVPYTEPAPRSLFGSMKGSVLEYERPFDPLDGDYDVNRE